MGQRWVIASIAAVGLLGCTDSITSPDSRDVTPTLSLPEYARQLHGDPFLRTVSEMLHHPQLAGMIDDAIANPNSTGASGGDGTQTTIASSRGLLNSVSTEGNLLVTETDVLNAVINVTLDRLSQVNEGAADTTTSAPPPSR
ncbi:MAG: hypothetical protein ACXWND_11170 [Gemmatimonadaceae bacterium]